MSRYPQIVKTTGLYPKRKKEYRGNKFHFIKIAVRPLFSKTPVFIHFSLKINHFSKVVIHSYVYFRTLII